MINLATQAVIKSHSKSKFYNPSKPEDYIPETPAFTWDAVGLVRSSTAEEVCSKTASTQYACAMVIHLLYASVGCITERGMLYTHSLFTFAVSLTLNIRV